MESKDTTMDDGNGSVSNGGGLFGLGGPAVSGNPFGSLARTGSNGAEEAGFEMVMSKDAKRKEKKRKREEKLKLVRRLIQSRCGLVLMCIRV